jgi:integrase
MSSTLTVTPRKTRQGTVHDVYFRHNKKRIRFTITDAVNYEEAVQKAQRIQQGVMAGQLAFCPKGARTYAAGSFGAFRTLYKKELEAEQLSDVDRPLGILDRILIPRWGHVPFSELARRHGVDLLLDLRKEGYQEQGIRRIINVARRYVALAIRHRLLPPNTSNPLVDLPLGQYIPRDRVATAEEVQQLMMHGSTRMQTALTLAFNLPLRQELILAANAEHVYRRPDGLWYRPPKAPTVIKGRPLELPLNATAASIFTALPADQPDIFEGWQADTFRKAWRRLCKNTEPAIIDLHFHDFRRNAGSALQEARVHPGVIALILGHKSQAVTDIYKTFDSYRPDLRHAVDVLDAAWRRLTETTQHSQGDTLY